MSSPLKVDVCDACGTAVWPPRSRCPHCGAGAWSPGDGSCGVAEQTTDVSGEAPLRLATVRLDAGPVVIARAAEVEPGDRVTLSFDEDGALDARTDPPEDGR